MPISFNGIPSGIRTPGTYVEVDNSRALEGLVPWMQRILLVGLKVTAGTAVVDTLVYVPSAGAAQGLFGPASMLSRMVAKAKAINPWTEMWAIPLADAGAGVAASAVVTITGSATEAGIFNLMIGGNRIPVSIASGDAAAAIATNAIAAITAVKDLACTAATGGSGVINLTAVNKGPHGNDLDVRWNYYTGEKLPAGVTVVYTTPFASGAGDPLVANAVAAMGDQPFDYIVWPFNSTAALDTIETELARRFGPMVQQQGIGFTAKKDTNSNLVTFGAGATRNSPHLSCLGLYDLPTPTEEEAAMYGAAAAFYLNIDPGRPLRTIPLTGMLPPLESSDGRWTREERQGLLSNGISTWVVDAEGNVLIERAITMYLKNASGVLDPSYLDVMTMALLMYIRYQWRTRMTLRFPRHKLADDDTQIGPGQAVARPKDVRAETIALFSELEKTGIIENIEEFKTNLIVERNGTDVNRIDVLLPADLINQFQVLAGQIAFIL